MGKYRPMFPIQWRQFLENWILNIQQNLGITSAFTIELISKEIENGILA